MKNALFLRFIPARAGNTPNDTSGLTYPPVHPRAGGEHLRRSIRHDSVCGSSPRGRGTHAADRSDAGPDRFIPARAGNTPFCCLPFCCLPVHPRAGGEHYPIIPVLVSVRGSSPRGRGTRKQSGQCWLRWRFIPARAGNTSPLLSSSCHSSVHPRAGGEHLAVLHRFFDHAGSSPRGRGTPEAVVADVRVSRFIPARAGNTRLRFGQFVRQVGSSPRGRGTRMILI